MKKLTLILFLFPGMRQGYTQESNFTEFEVVVDSEGWNLIGDLNLPNAPGTYPAVLLLHKANGDRHVYRELANELAKRSIISLRLDLRGHGNSTNLGKFVPYQNDHDTLIWDAENDVIAAIKYLKNHPKVDGAKIGSVGGSYSGEEMAEAGRIDQYVQAYVELSPGSFSDESIDGIDISGVPWLFIASRNERHLKEITQLVYEKSKEVELLIIPGSHHATRILENYAGMSELIAVWLDDKLKND